MLGIRRYQGVAIDLWQGESSRFDRDITVEATLSSLSHADGLGKRHAVIEADEESPSEALATVKAFLSEPRAAGGIRRITLVLPDGERYTAFQKVLFSLFPEEDL